ncbi:MAG: hypothetical protein ACI85F_003003 [Bacteroidia bacterium]|jgi:hypothetical protein
MVFLLAFLQGRINASKSQDPKELSFQQLYLNCVTGTPAIKQGAKTGTQALVVSIKFGFG